VAPSDFTGFYSWDIPFGQKEGWGRGIKAMKGGYVHVYTCTKHGAACEQETGQGRYIKAKGSSSGGGGGGRRRRVKREGGDRGHLRVVEFNIISLSNQVTATATGRASAWVVPFCIAV
jgi:hypothetical protein